MSMHKCEHTWYEEGVGEGAVRCCKRCGFIMSLKDSTKLRTGPDLSGDEARALRKRAGLDDRIIGDIGHELRDVNRELGQRFEGVQLLKFVAQWVIVLVLVAIAAFAFEVRFDIRILPDGLRGLISGLLSRF